MGVVSNEYRCHIESVLKWFTAVAAAALLIPAAAFGHGMSKPEGKLLVQVNAVRARHGLAPLRVDTHLERAARSHSREMLTTDDFTHGAFGTRMSQFDVRGSLAGENLAWGTGARGTARGIVAAWLASPMHRANLLRPSFRRIGIGDLVGSFQGTSGATVVTADFAG
jgi:uncharacterized protein YkwD